MAKDGLFARLALSALMLGLLSARPALAQTTDPIAKAIDELVLANRILADQGVLDGYGHVSVRHPTNPNHYLLARSMAPQLVTKADIYEFDFDGNPVTPMPAGTSPYLERFIHGEIYRVRLDVGSVVHSHSQSVIPFCDTRVELKPMYHMSSFLVRGAPVFEIRDFAGRSTDMLIRNPDLGRYLAMVLGPTAEVALMRGHGNVVTGANVKLAVFRAVYTEVNAKLQIQALSINPHVKYLTDDEGIAAEITNDGTINRPWDLWVRRVQGQIQ